MRKTGNYPTKVCERCKNEYKPKSGTQKFCDVCRVIVDKERKRKHYIKTHPNAYIEKPQEYCVVCGEKKSASFDGLPYCKKHWLRMYTHGTTELLERKSKNKYDISGNIAICKTVKGECFLLDKEDVERCLKYTWCYDPRGYLAATTGSGIHQVLHRFVLGLQDYDGNVVDHINGNKGDNRKINLRVCNPHENGRNLKKKKNNKSGYPGVEITKAGTFFATLMINGKSIGLGTYKTFDEAKEARIKGELKYYGEFSPTLSRGTLS